MRIVADTQRCVGAGQCVLADPEAFDQHDSDGTVSILRPVPTNADELAKAKEAVAICPGRALSLREDSATTTG
ncbi:ferredoxin [Streptomyces sp. NBC_01239]|uniref:ferredoxin n=1 Tax=Streptomyces sp. NBC_01239 TaxID=2903792 RepID=UPI0022542135|nr:ferredoxin [Streptomyces sp. NBC_01239]MCX4816297.1 ferredoxin [Streptomyces sp. NBC_01239]